TSTGEPAQASAPAPTGEARRGRILLVEDDALVARAVRRTLSREHEVVVVETGRAALEAIAREKFDLVISDLMMPEMTGMDLHATLLRTNPEVARRMVFFSGGAFTDAARDFLRGVPNLQIEKPFDPQQLRELIRRLLTACQDGLETFHAKRGRKWKRGSWFFETHSSALTFLASALRVKRF